MRQPARNVGGQNNTEKGTRRLAERFFKITRGGEGMKRDTYLETPIRGTQACTCLWRDLGQKLILLRKKCTDGHIQAKGALRRGY